MKDFNSWNEVKKKVNVKTKISIPKDREIYWTCIGENIGNEQDGKSDRYTRPVLVFKRFNNSLFLGIPLSTNMKKGNFFHHITFNGKSNNTLLVQMKVFDTKRLEKKIGKISVDEFKKLKISLKQLLNI
jgi:mRNA-degrading endonuclease toxin of MazEF toxin-antitoxin module